jgi:alpha-beta hydrolase superfamily lysophospholipase
LWAVVLLLGACAPTLQPRGNQMVTPMIAGDALTMRDGIALPLRVWQAEGTPKAVIVALHGMSDYSNAFALPAKVWAKDGITTLAYDQRGFGAAPNPGLWAGSDLMRDDLHDAVAAARARYPHVPVFALGESMGGAVLLTALASADGLNLDGAILVAPAVWSRGDMPLTYRVALFLGAHLLPGMILSNSAASHVVTIMPSDNIPMLRAMGRDPLVQKKTRTDTIYGLVDLMDEARHAVPGRAPPILLLTGDRDQVIPRPPTDAVIAALGQKAEVRRYPGGYHMLLRDLDGDRVSADIAAWTERHRNGPVPGPL